MGLLKKRLGEVAILLSTLLWGSIGIFTRALTEFGFSSVQIVTVRAVITAITMGIVIAIKDPKLFKFNLKDIWMFFGTGICSFLFFNICYMSSIVENSLSVACILMYTSPIWVTLMSALLFKEKLTFKSVGALIICFGGSALVCLSSSLKLTNIGLVYGLLSGFGYALYSIFGKYAAEKYNTLTITFYTFLFAAFGALPICNVKTLAPLVFTVKGSLLSVAIAVTCTILPYLLYTYGLSNTTAGKASILSITEPCIAAVVGMIAFSEMFGIQGVIGILAVIGGLVLLESRKKIEKE
jgi:drug/metabolite transporter (DMT)-like permease